MTPDEMRVAIAELLRWSGPFAKQWIPDGCAEGDLWAFAGTDPSGEISKLPNYPESLDACAEFEATLTVKELKKYAVHLKRLTKPPFGTPYYFDAWWAAFLRATPAQRCEAYLRLKGLWKQTH